MADSNNESKVYSKDGDQTKPSNRPFSPFPYGSPLAQGSPQTSFAGSPGQKLLLGSLSQIRTNGEAITPRLKGQDLYGGPIMFGGLGSARKARLHSASPYNVAMRNRTARRNKEGQEVVSMQPSFGVHNTSLPPSSLPSTAPSSPQSSSDSIGTASAPLSSTAKLILSTLDRLSSGGTPISDAKKIPLPSPTLNRAEKRKLLETELGCSLSSPSRRRARLGGGGLALSLAGPPLRKNFSPSLGQVGMLSKTISVPQVPSTSSNPSSESRIPTPQAVVTESTASQSGQRLLDSVNETVNATSKSNLKVKTKVTDRDRSKLANNCLEAPKSPPKFLSEPIQLKVDKLPVLNFGNNTTVKLPPTTSNGLSCTSGSFPEVVEKNNNKTPVKRALEEVVCDNVKKQKAEDTVVSKSSAKTNHDHDTSATLTEVVTKKTSISEDIHIVPESKPIKFDFKVPKPVIESVKSVKDVGKQFTFSLPTSVKTLSKSSLLNGPSKSRDLNVLGPKNKKSEGIPSLSTNANSNFQFNSLSSMPDVTNNLVKKMPIKDKLKGTNSSSRLPDITAGTGFGGFVPAKELKTGSVMDILGKKA